MTSRMMKWAGHVARIRDKTNAYRKFVGKLDGKRPLWRPRRRWVDNIKIDLREIGWGGLDWIDVAKDRDKWRALLNTAMNLRVPESTGNTLSSCKIGGFSRRAQLHNLMSCKCNSTLSPTLALVYESLKGC
jgi:hypothetical protein